MNFKSKYTNTNETIKLQFLDAIIRNNAALQQEFVNFTKADSEIITGIPYADFLEIVKAAQQDFKETFEMVDLENPDWDSYQSPHAEYIEEWEQYQQASEQEFAVIFDNLLSDAIDMIIGQHPDELIAMLIGIDDAARTADIDDPVESFGDVNEYLVETFQQTLNDITEKLRLSAIAESAINEAVKMFFSYCDNDASDASLLAHNFQQFLMALAEKISEPHQMLTLLDQSTIKRQALPELVLLLTKNAGNHTEWLSSAREYYLNDRAVARQLLEHYFDTDKSEFLKTANELFEKDKRYWAGQLKEYVSAEFDTALFVKVYYQLTVDQREIEHYRKIQEYLSAAEIDQLLDEIEGLTAFKVQVLDAEERYEEIRVIVETSNDNYEYASLIQPILKVFPEFCFRHIAAKATKTAKTRRGRDIYQLIVEWLKLAKEIPGFTTESQNLARALYNHKPTLPALRDEMRRGGVA
jgi:hypothetical protein